MSENPYLYALTVDPDKPLREAMELVARLTAECDALRAQRDRLTAARDEALSLFREQQMTYVSDVQRLTAERDEARREAAKFYARQFYKEDAVDRMSRIYAEECGWDCFIKQEDGK